eukprot:CAMPEP_0184548926 /NCGR_PEP_ID=MMETSP0199_2-20130426/6504_1 /TAXON_ID=1112570 /ORGANISM="Thraustochytrium sp., Strain LLF1b" /LENGTH=270 /DNA_ID=CAMNT_0026943601 /DNA_START=62 /DNA_END=870 /DNA_ORIENTATION=-
MSVQGGALPTSRIEAPSAALNMVKGKGVADHTAEAGSKISIGPFGAGQAHELVKALEDAMEVQGADVVVQLEPGALITFDGSVTATNVDAFPAVPVGIRLTVQGNGAMLQRAKGSSVKPFRFWTVKGLITLSDLHLCNGFTLGEFGGGLVVNPGATVNLNRCKFSDCLATGHHGENGAEAGGNGGGGGQGALGGAIYSHAGNIRAVDCKFFRNCAMGGRGGDSYPNVGFNRMRGSNGGGILGGRGGASGESGGHAQEPTLSDLTRLQETA